MLLLGFTATSAQIILLREFVSTFHGNELVIGAFLSVWLLATAVGSGPLARLFRGTPHPEGVRQRAERGFGTVQIVAALGLVFSILGFLAPPAWLRPGHGEVTGLLPALACAALYLSPLCALLGLLFPLGARMLAPSRSSGGVPTAYFLEAMGAGAGGVLVSLLAVRVLSPFQGIALLAAANFLVASILLAASGRSVLRYISIGLVVVSALASALDPVTDWATTRRWGDLSVLAARRTPYGNLTAVSLGSDFSFFQDGLLVFSTEDLQSAEEVGHVPLLEHPDPKSVLLVGGGLGGALAEMLKEPSLTTVDYVELDPGLIELAKDVLPGRLTSPLADPRVSLHYTDGRRFLQATKQRYDVIVMDLPPPYTAQLNRFYTREIFAVAKRHLKEGGVFSFSAPGVQEYISDDVAAFLGSLYRTSAAVFPEPVFLPLGKSIFVCSPRLSGYVTSSWDSLLSRLRQRRIETLYLRDYYLASMLSPEREAYARTRVLGQTRTDLNTDLRPISFYYDLVAWSAEHERLIRAALLWISARPWSLLAAAVAAGLLLLALSRSSRRETVLPLAALATSGFAAMVLELEIVLAFQLFYGSLYDRIGLLLASYMVGLGLGAFLAKRFASDSSRPAFSSGIVQVLTGCFALVFLSTVIAVASVQQTWVLRVMEWVFLVFALAAGGLGGALFTTASRAFFGRASGPAGTRESGAGITYAWDLGGSWVGAALCSVVLFPVVGIPRATLAVVFLLFASAAGLLLARDGS